MGDRQLGKKRLIEYFAKDSVRPGVPIIRIEQQNDATNVVAGGSVQLPNRLKVR